MVASIDGRIDCHMVDHISGDEYYTALDSLNCPASLEGRVTMQKYYAEPGYYNSFDSSEADIETFFRATTRSDFHICPDTLGSLKWKSGVLDDGRPLLVIASEEATEEYLDYLRDKEISYIVTGKGKINLARAMQILRDEFGVERMTVLGGGLINGGFLNAGLIDEVSLLLAPGIDGRVGRRALFDGIVDQQKLPTRLKLHSVERFENDVVWLRYLVNTNKDDE